MYSWVQISDWTVGYVFAMVSFANARWNRRLSQESSIDKHLYRNILKNLFHPLHYTLQPRVEDPRLRWSQPAHKVSRLASVFVSVAAVYIDSKEQEARNECVKPQRLALWLLMTTQVPASTIKQQHTRWRHGHPSTRSCALLALRKIHR